jgi:hypothetical protein
MRFEQSTIFAMHIPGACKRMTLMAWHPGDMHMNKRSFPGLQL